LIRAGQNAVDQSGCCEAIHAINARAIRERDRIVAPRQNNVLNVKEIRSRRAICDGTILRVEAAEINCNACRDTAQIECVTIGF
jgi:hypothetical protein